MNHWNQDLIADNSTPMSCNLVVAATIFQIAETFPSRNQTIDKIKFFIDNSFRTNVHLGIGYWSLGWEDWKSKLIQRAQVNSLSLWMQLIVHCVSNIKPNTLQSNNTPLQANWRINIYRVGRKQKRHAVVPCSKYSMGHACFSLKFFATYMLRWQLHPKKGSLLLLFYRHLF